MSQTPLPSQTDEVDEGVSPAETVDEGVSPAETVDEGASPAETVDEGASPAETVGEGASPAETVGEGASLDLSARPDEAFAPHEKDGSAEVSGSSPTPALEPKLVTRLRTCFKSPANDGGELKDQDDAAAAADGHWAVLADGVTTSPHGGEAAREAVESVSARLHSGPPFSTMMIESVMKGVSDRLRLKREEYRRRTLKGNEQHHDAMRAFVLEAMAEKMASSGQTTLALVVVREQDAVVWVVGDSGVFLRTDDGRSQVWPSTVSPREPGNRTYVLPDHLDRRAVETFAINESCDIVVATDGFYHAFESIDEMFSWLRAHADALPIDPRAGTPLPVDLAADLHGRLAATRGDDDISAVWIEIKVRA